MEEIITDNSAESSEKKPAAKPKGRPKGTGTGNTKLLRTHITPRQERLLQKIRIEWNISESETVRTALNEYFNALIRAGDLVDPGPPPPTAETAATESTEDGIPSIQSKTVSS